MESENLEEISSIFNQIDVENNPGSEKNEQFYVYKRYQNKPQPIPRRIFPERIDFDKYVQENCDNKFKILDRSTFHHEIKRPIIIFFHHFREKCVYLTKWLDRIYQLALKYGDQIEFIAADMIDIDVINPKWNPLSHFCRLVSPENDILTTFAIDEKKRIHQHYDAYQTLEGLSELCENLLSGKLYPSQPIPERNNTKLVKICVHDNYDDLILKSTKDILFISSLEQNFGSDPNYENVALQLRDYNVETVFMEAEVNYIPFEYNVYSYPTVLFIPHNDKNNFVYFEASITEENLVAFAKELLENPEALKFKQEDQQKRYCQRKSVNVSNDFEMDFMELPQYLAVNFEDRIKVLDPKWRYNTKNWTLIIFMNFQGKCLAHHIRWLNKVYQVAKNSYTIQYYVADYKNIHIFNTKWKPEDFRNTANPKDEIPKIFAINRSKHTFEFNDFTSATSLYYFESSLTNGYFYYSQCYNRNQDDQLVKTWVADNFHVLLRKSRKNVFITFYDPDHETTEKILNILEEIANEIKNRNLHVEVVKFNAKENYVDLEYAYHTYPVHYFISQHNKKENIRYIDSDLNKDNILEFIISCAEKK